MLCRRQRIGLEIEKLRLGFDERLKTLLLSQVFRGKFL